MLARTNCSAYHRTGDAEATAGCGVLTVPPSCWVKRAGLKFVAGWAQRSFSGIALQPAFDSSTDMAMSMVTPHTRRWAAGVRRLPAAGG